MPRQTQIDKRFSKSILKKIVHTHRWAVILGLLAPAILFLFSVIASGQLFGAWPSVLSQVYEHVILFGWAGVYLFAMLFIIYPELNDLNGQKNYILAKWLNIYGIGVLSLVIGGLLWVFTKNYTLFVWPIILGSLLQIIGWFGALRGFFKMLKQKKRFTAFDQLVAIGLIPFTFALIALLVAYVTLFISGDVLFSVDFRTGFRFFPMIGIGLILISMLIRMSPEMLNWRPLDEKKLRNIYAYILVAIAFLASGYIWFHLNNDPLGTLLYVLGAIGVFSGLIWLFSSLDLWAVKLSRRESQEHVAFMYASLIWLVISMIGLLFYVGWEVTRGEALSAFWSNIFIYLFFIGFVINGVLSIFVYVNNQIEGLILRASKVSLIVFGILFWVVLLRVIILPLMLIYGWPGFVAFQWGLDGLLYLGVFLMIFSLLVKPIKALRR